MVESPSHPKPPNRFQLIFDALISVGYADAHKPEVSDSNKLLGALVWCVAALKPNYGLQFNVVRIGNLTQEDKMYERRFSELYVHIQGKHQQTQKYYDAYNTLLEIKELMLKEKSFLNSISSQFQDAITTTAGRSKLIDSME